MRGPADGQSAVDEKQDGLGSERRRTDGRKADIT